MLWTKLVKSGISCKAINMIKSMYSNVKSCIKLSPCMNVSEFFDVTIGLKQGEPLSPLMFILFINDITNSITIDNLSEKDLELLSMYLILFADDIVLFTTDPISLQHQLDNIYEYSVHNGLKINVNKTKVCIFEKRKQQHNLNFVINGESIELVNEFTYLGLKFTYTGNFSSAVKALHDQALKAYHNLLSLFENINLSIKIKLSLFDAMVSPILLYGSEVWGAYNCKEIDKLHVKFCKYILGVKKQTPNCAVYGELGRLPLSVIAQERCVKFWIKIKNNTDSPMHSMYSELYSNLNVANWAGRLNSILDHLGFTFLREQFDFNFNYFPTIKRRIRDQYIQTWNEEVTSMSKLDYFRNFKPNFEYEDYLNIIMNDSLRKYFTRLRLSSHDLEIESGRYHGISRNDRVCKLCSQKVVESEYHFLLCCPKYYDLRRNFFRHSSWPTLQKFNSLMSTSRKTTLYNICKFIKEASAVRKNALQL